MYVETICRQFIPQPREHYVQSYAQGPITVMTFKLTTRPATSRRKQVVVHYKLVSLYQSVNDKYIHEKVLIVGIHKMIKQ